MKLNPAGRVYVTVVCIAGLSVLGHSILALLSQAIPGQWLVLAGLTFLSGAFTIKVPSLQARLSVSETFVFAAVLLFGTPAGTITVALDTLVAWVSRRRSRETLRNLFNLASASLSIWCASQAFYLLAQVPPQVYQTTPLPQLFGPLVALTVVYFSINTTLVAFALSFERAESAFWIWRKNFLWLSVNYFGGASVAALLVSYTRTVDFTALGIILPLLIISYLTFKTSLGRIEDATKHVDQVNQLYLSTIETLAMAVDAKDQVTHGHIRRVQRYAVGLAEAIGVRDGAQIRAIEAAALLHDMGKLAIPEYILNKPGKLTESEFEKMKLHAGIGADILSAVEFPYPVVPIVRHHHENWDGTGYPDKLRGTEIPLGARILSVVDCFDALTSDRPYRPALRDEDALKIIMARRAAMYDPLVVDTFVAELPRLAASLADIGPESETLQKIADLNNPSVSATKHEHVSEQSRSEVDPAALLALLSSAPGSLDAADMSLVLLGRLRQLMSVDACVLYLVGPSGDTLVAAGVAGHVPDGFLGTSIEFGGRIAGWAAANRTPVRNSDAELDLGPSARSVGLRSSLLCPLIADDILRGAVGLYSKIADPFSSDHQRLIELVAPQLGEFLAQLAHSPRVGSITSLSGHNVSGWFELREMFAQPRAATEAWFPITVVTVTCLQDAMTEDRSTQVLHTIRSGLRLGDCVFRLTDKVYVVLLLRSSDESAPTIVHNLRTALGARVGSLGVSFAIGARVIRHAEESIEATIRGVQAASLSEPHRHSVH
jgi:putative nucleotidyltransferase with HDIG domain